MSKKSRVQVSTVHLREELLEKEKEYHGKIDILGVTAMTNPAKVSSSRNIMMTSHINQRVNLTKSELPLLMTGVERDVGLNSTGYYQTDTELEVIAIVPKYEAIGNPMNHYTIFFYDSKNDRYDIIDKQHFEELTERYGYHYNTEKMDSLQVGDIVPEGEVLYKTSGYDEEMNYGYGTNARFCYLASMDTIEDAIAVSESLSEKMKSEEMEVVRVSVNDNDILINLYGEEGDYRGFPDIGTKVKDNVVCAKRRMHNNQLLYDLRTDNLNKINYTSDFPFYYSGRVYDIKVFSNKTLDEIPDTKFNRQFRQYIMMQNTYHQKIVDICDELYDSGKECSNDINYLYKRSVDILDPEIRWQDEQGRSFSNIIIELSIYREVGIAVGQKLVGRVGNKGVVSRIYPDDQMPLLENGEQIDILFNPMGIINRLNPEQLFELSITFIMGRLYERLDEMIQEGKSREERDKLLLNIVEYFAPVQSEKLKEFLEELNMKEHDLFYQQMIHETGLSIIKPPMWEEEPMFYRLQRLYKEHDWIKPHDVYYNRFGRIVKGMRPLYVGMMYIMKLKQTSEKGFSARSTGPVTHKGLPEKTQRRRKHQEPYSKTPIRFGGDETSNMHIGVSEELIAHIHMFYRSSVVGRQLLSNQLATSIDQVDVSELLADERVTNRNVEILQALFKLLGVGLEYELDIGHIIHDQTEVKPRINPLTGEKVNVTDVEYYILKIEAEMKNDINFNDPLTLKVYSPDEYNRIYMEEVKTRFIDKYGYWKEK